MCPLNKGNCSGSRPFSLIGMTANAPPPLASQLTEIYCGFAFGTIRAKFQCSNACVQPLRGSCPRHSWRSVYYRSIVPEQRISTRVRFLLSDPTIAPSSLAGRRHALRRMLAHGRCGKQCCMGYPRYFDERTKRPDICAHALAIQESVE